MPPETQNTNSLDPSIVALAKAIGMAESGGKYDAVGDNGNAQGAYQMTPGFLQKWSPKAGVQYQPGMKLSPEEQDKIAYTAVKEMGTNGDPAYPQYGKLTPSQIASAWNTGDPNMYSEDPSFGKNNAYGSIEGYVNEVKKNYESNASSINQPQKPKQYNPWEELLPNFWKNLTENTQTALGLIGGNNLKNIATAGLPLAGIVAGEALGGPGGAVIGGSLGQNASNAIFGNDNDQQPTTTNNAGNETNSQQFPSINLEGSTSQPKFKENQSLISSANTLKEAITQALEKTQSNRTFLDTSVGQQAVNTASVFGLIDSDTNGNMTFDEEKRKKLLSSVGDLQDKVIESENGSASPLSVSNYAGQYIGENRYTTAVDKQQAAEQVKKEISARRIPLNGQMSLRDMREAQKQHYFAAQGGYRAGKTSAEILAHKALGNAYGRVIRDNLSDKELYDRAKKMEQNLINVKELNKRLGNKKAPKNESLIKGLLQSAGKYAAVYIGDKVGGAIGAILGDMVGTHIEKSVNRKFGHNIFDTPQMKAALTLLSSQEPKAYTKLKEELGKQGIKLQNIKKESSDLPSLIKSEKINKEFKEGTKLDTTLEKLHKVTTRPSSSPKQNQGLLKLKPKEINPRQ